MLVKEVMTRSAETIGRHEKLDVAARRMREAGVGALVVQDEAGAPIGFVTDRDIVVRSTAEGRDPRTTDVETVMTPQLITCAETDELAVAAETMADRAVRRIVVLDDAARAAGLLSVDDVSFQSAALAAEILARSRSPDRPPFRSSKWWD